MLSKLWRGIRRRSRRPSWTWVPGPAGTAVQVAIPSDVQQGDWLILGMSGKAYERVGAEWREIPAS